jgi:hypothetical protein
LRSLKPGSVKRSVSPEHCPAPDQYLARCCYQSQFLGFTTTHQALVEGCQWTVLPFYATKCAHKQTTSEWTIALPGDTWSLANTGATLIWLRVKTYIGYQTIFFSFSICQLFPTMHHYQDIEHILLSHTRYCQQKLPLFLQVGMSFQSHWMANRAKGCSYPPVGSITTKTLVVSVS